MKIEKLNENKIRIILNNQDLIDKHVDYNAFMSNSAEAQDLYLCMLEEAEEKIGFVTKDYKIKIEALAMDSGDFIVIVTRFNEEQKSNSPVRNKKITARRKSSIILTHDEYGRFSGEVRKYLGELANGYKDNSANFSITSQLSLVSNS